MQLLVKKVTGAVEECKHNPDQQHKDGVVRLLQTLGLRACLLTLFRHLLLSCGLASVRRVAFTIKFAAAVACILLFLHWLLMLLNPSVCHPLVLLGARLEHVTVSACA